MAIKIENEVIVIGTNHYNTLGVIRSLGEKGIPVNLILISKRKDYVNKSKYISNTWLVNKTDSKILEILTDNFNNEKHKPIIIPTSDFAVKVLDCNFESLKVKYILPNIDNEAGRITKLMDKMRMNKVAKETGLTVPESWKLELNDEIEPIYDKVTYPCIVKPLSSIYGKKEDIVICKDGLELTNSLLNLKENYKRVLIQEYIDGQDSRMIEIVGCVTRYNKEIIIPGIIEKIREYPLTAGSTSFALVTKNSKFINISSVYKFLNKLNYSGIFDIEFKYANGKTYFIEINFRNGAPAYALTKAGVNIPYLWCLEAAGVDISKLNKKINKDFQFMMEVRDFKHVIRGDVKFSSWLGDLIKTKAFLFLDFKDMRPILTRLFKG